MNRLGGCAYLVCCVSARPDWQATLHGFLSIWLYFGVMPLRPCRASTSAFFHATRAHICVSSTIHVCHIFFSRRKCVVRKCNWPKSVSEGGWETCFRRVLRRFVRLRRAGIGAPHVTPIEPGDSNAEHEASARARAYLDEYPADFHRNLRAFHLHTTNKGSNTTPLQQTLTCR
jgi:hypothetical protein